MLGDLTIWNGTKEVVIFRWYERCWRWLLRKNSPRRYKQIAQEMEKIKFTPTEEASEIKYGQHGR